MMQNNGSRNESMSRDPLVGAVVGSMLLATVCCLMPILIGLTGAVGVSALWSYAGYVLVPAWVFVLFLIGHRIYRQRRNCGATRDIVCASDSFDGQPHPKINADRGPRFRTNRSCAGIRSKPRAMKVVE